MSDPWVYIERFAGIPKLAVNALGDEFFSPDNDMWWFDDMPGQKYRLMLPNAEHSLATAEEQAINGAAAFALAVVHGLPMPDLSWQFSGNRPEGAPKAPGGFPKYGTGAASGDVTLQCDASPTNVTAWFAYSAGGTGRRDFRLAAGYPKIEPQLVLWLPYDVTGAPIAPGKWEAAAPDEIKGQWAGLILDMRFPFDSGCEQGAGDSCLGLAAQEALARARADGIEFDVSTSVSITPATYPFPDCNGKACKGHLL